jgi:hypothetical protein
MAVNHKLLTSLVVFIFGYSGPKLFWQMRLFPEGKYTQLVVYFRDSLPVAILTSVIHSHCMLTLS